jgi:predicted murein hydrolase (TIGR00659 family)
VSGAGRLAEIWVYLAQTPLLWLTLTVVAYVLADWLHARARRHPLLHPVLVSVAALLGVLVASRTPYATYFEGAQFVHFLLGPAVVALAVPLHRELGRIRARAPALAAALAAGSATAALSAVGVAALLGASRATLVSLAPKSVTAPVAMGVAERLGGLPSLTAALVILTGIVGATAGPSILRLARVRDPAARGFALGLNSHGLGTARAFQLGEQDGAFAGLAMGLNALATPALLPALARLLGW